jgi:hypothetical protein
MITKNLEPTSDASAEFLNDKMSTIDNLIDPVMERLTEGNGGVDPQAAMSIPEIVEWAGDKYGYDDPDVAELRKLAEDYDYCREQLAELQ